MKPITPQFDAPVSEGTAIDVNRSRRIYCFNSASTNQTISVINENGVIGEMKIAPNTYLILNKYASEKMYSSSADVKFTGISFRW